MIVIGIVGGIGTGKSTVARIFAQLGATAFDADKITHRLMQPGQGVWRRIIGRFGKGILTPSRQINRQALGKIVFRSRDKLKQLTQIIHPAVRLEIRQGVKRLRGRQGVNSVAVLDVPLLLESGGAYRCDLLVAVTAPRGVVLKRLQGQRGWEAQELSMRERFQFSRQEKIRRADFVVDNGGTHAATRRQVLRIWRELQRRDCFATLAMTEKGEV